MEELFTVLNRAVEGSAAVAMSAALAWGVLSIVLSPCHLSSIPLIIAFMGEQSGTTNRRAFAVSTVFSLGILVTIAAIGVVTAIAGRMLGDLGPAIKYAVAIVFLLLGLHFLDVIPMPWSSRGVRSPKRKGLWPAFLLGLIFGIGVGPCTFAFMAPMLGVTLAVSASNWPYGVLLLLLYGIGHSAVIVIAGTSVDRVQRYLNWNQASRGAVILRRICGILVIAGGFYLLYVT
jgi:cytochrome c-type biogenesis protein